MKGHRQPFKRQKRIKQPINRLKLNGKWKLKQNRLNESIHFTSLYIRVYEFNILNSQWYHRIRAGCLFYINLHINIELIAFKTKSSWENVQPLRLCLGSFSHVDRCCWCALCFGVQKNFSIVEKLLLIRMNSTAAALTKLLAFLVKGVRFVEWLLYYSH